MAMQVQEIDYLTGFYTRRYLDTYLEKLIWESKESRGHFSLALFDIDKFKFYNDKYGHVFGDEILRYMSVTLRLTLGTANNQIFRYGGDEFIVIFLNKDPKEAIALVKTYAHNILHRMVLFENKFFKVRITLSCGIAGFPQDASRAADLIHKADRAMYESKRLGRNRVTLFGTINMARMKRVLSGIIAALLISAALIYLTVTYLSIKARQSQAKPRAIYIGHKVLPAKESEPAPVVTEEPIEEKKALDTITLKTGGVLRGRIISDSENDVTLALISGQGEILTRLRKADIESIEFGAARTKD